MLIPEQEAINQYNMHWAQEEPALYKTFVEQVLKSNYFLLVL